MRRRTLNRVAAALTFCAGMFVAPVAAETTRVAVAANFTAVAEQLAEEFEARSGHTVELSFGATGALYTQVTQAAPFDVLLAADDERPERAVTEGFGVEGSVFTYAIGRLVLYGVGLNGDAAKSALLGGAFDRLAIANPDTAPYGAAAMDVLRALDLIEAARPRLVTGENISQTLQFVETGNAELGFVALSQVVGKDPLSFWLVPAELYTPIRQDAVLLTSGRDNPAATGFLAFLRSPRAAAVIEAAGYGRP